MEDSARSPTRKDRGKEDGARRIDERTLRINNKTRPFVMAAGLAAIPLTVALADIARFDEPWVTIIHVANWITWGIFVAELVLLLAVARDKWYVLRRRLFLVAVVVLTVPVVPHVLVGLRALTLLRIFAVFNLNAAVARRLFSITGVKFAAFIVVLTALAGGAAFHEAERNLSTWQGVWLAIVTMSTVGYGDVSPQTTSGKIIATVILAIGIGFISLVTGALTQKFIARVQEQKREQGILEPEDIALRDLDVKLDRLSNRLDRIESALRARPPGR